MLIMSTAFALAEENLMFQSVERPWASRGPSEVVVTSNGTASAFQDLARWLARSQASFAVMAVPLPVFPAAQAACICADTIGTPADISTSPATNPLELLMSPPFT